MIRRSATLPALLAVLLTMGGFGEFLHDSLHHGADCSTPEKCPIRYLLFVAAAALVSALILLSFHADVRPALVPNAGLWVPRLAPVPAIAPRAPPAH